MRVNEETVLVGQNVLLVPYRKEHVEQYNTWMQSPILQEQTASEPLTLQEEYEMQQSWWLDDDKLTFIIMALPESTSPNLAGIDLITSGRMIGDVNVFLSDPDDEEETIGSSPTKHKRGELEIMIADPTARRKGYATEALQLLLGYITASPTPRPADTGSIATHHASSLPLKPHNLFLKISLQNQPSINMFKKLGFQEYKVSDVFQEVELRLAPGKQGAASPPTTVVQWAM